MGLRFFVTGAMFGAACVIWGIVCRRLIHRMVVGRRGVRLRVVMVQFALPPAPEPVSPVAGLRLGVEINRQNWQAN